MYTSAGIQTIGNTIQTTYGNWLPWEEAIVQLFINQRLARRPDEFINRSYYACIQRRHKLNQVGYTNPAKAEEEYQMLMAKVTECDSFYKGIKAFKESKERELMLMLTKKFGYTIVIKK